MDKPLLRDILNNKISSGDKIKLKMFGSPEVELTVKEIKKGRGKGGLARVVHTEQNLEFGTSDSDKIISITILKTGEKFGTTNELEFDPKHLVKNEESGRKLKAQLQQLLTIKPETIKIKLTSDMVPLFNGIYNLVKASSVKGRYGQIILKLEDQETKNQFEIWSHRHATVLTKIEFIKT